MHMDSHQDVLSNSGIGIDSVLSIKSWKIRHDPFFVLSARDDNKLERRGDKHLILAKRDKTRRETKLLQPLGRNITHPPSTYISRSEPTDKAGVAASNAVA